MWFYLGTSADPKNPAAGIYACQLDEATGALSEPQLAVHTRRPSFLALSPDEKFIVACNEIDDMHGKRQGGVSSFAIGAADVAKLTLVNEQPSGGTGPCFVEIDPTGRCVLTANYASGSVAVLPIDPATGKLSPPSAKDQHAGTGPDKSRQDGPHAHSMRVAPAGAGAATPFTLACDLGVDKVFVYKLDAARGTLTPNDPSFVSTVPGGGPRHTAFSHDGRFVYVVNEMGNSVSVFAWDATRGVLTPVQTITTLPEGFHGTTKAAEVAVHPNRKFLYASNRGFDSIACFTIDESTGRLTSGPIVPTGGSFPRHFAVDPSGKWMVVAHQNSNDVVTFRIEQRTGGLAPTGAKVEAPAPTCVRFLTAR